MRRMFQCVAIMTSVALAARYTVDVNMRMQFFEHSGRFACASHLWSAFTYWQCAASTSRSRVFVHRITASTRASGVCHASNRRTATSLVCQPPPCQAVLGAAPLTSRKNQRRSRRCSSRGWPSTAPSMQHLHRQHCRSHALPRAVCCSLHIVQTATSASAAALPSTRRCRNALAEKRKNLVSARCWQRFACKATAQ